MKLGVVGIIVEDKSVAQSVNAILSEYSNLIVGRMGLPDISGNISLISVAVKGTNESISAMTGKIGRIKNVKIKSAVSDVEV